MYKNSGLTCILVVRELTNVSTEHISAWSKNRKLQSINILHPPTQVTKPRLKTRYFSTVTLPAEYIGQTPSNLKLLRSTEWRNLYIAASFLAPYNLFQRSQFHYHSWTRKTLKRQAQCERVSSASCYAVLTFPNLGSIEHSATGKPVVTSVRCQLPLC
jgi:hypothetical protein